MLMSLLLVVILGSNNVKDVNGLSSSKSPGDQFRLNNWKLTLPDSSASEISPDDLEDDYESSYFYTASDGSMTFYVKGSGGTTDGSNYPRSELRQLCNPDASNPDRYNWRVGDSDSYNYVEGTYRIGDLDSSSRKVVIQQIHAYDAPPLIKIQAESNKVYALIKLDEDGDDEDKVLIGEFDDDEIFSLKTVMSSGYLKVYFNDEQKTNLKVREYWSGYTNYFKTGNYLQSSSSSAYAYIHLYYLKVYTPDSKCTYDSSFTYDDDAASAAGNTAAVASAVSIIALLLIAGGIYGFCYWKKNKSGKASFKDSIDESAATKQPGDTPIVSGENNEAGQIEISVPVEETQ
mmetsp:Transcript_14262/g.12770  ORF Transcript_14262/g.12770 Transcript_14262/m.12770 type:complete len:346 (+) Transcript_14262:139-1176(+)